MRYQNEQENIFSLELTDRSKHLFLNMARWTKFLALVGFITMGLMVIVFGIMAAVNLYDVSRVGPNSIFYRFGAGGAFVFLMITLGFNFYPIYSLMQFSLKVKRAINTSDKEMFEQSVNHLKNTFVFMGILMIIGIAIYGLGIVAVILRLG